MKSVEDVESYLMRLGVGYETVKPGIWLIQVNGQGRLAVSLAGPVVAFRLKVMDLPAQRREELYRQLLELNTTEMVHGAFGIEGDAAVIVHALELENLDFNEFQAVVDDMSMAISKYQSNLARYMGAQPPTAASVPA
jgi:Putative bacterial sensory transduction regulator